MKITPNNITKLKKNEVFVFGSNLNGAHIGGAAKLALDKFGAQNGNYEGIQGQSFAIPTLGKDMSKLHLSEISGSVSILLTATKLFPKKHFLVTEIGCGIAGFTHGEIAPLFKEFISIENISLPQKFVDLLIKKGYKVTDKNMACRGYKYELNKIYIHTGRVSPCNSGFHYCPELVDCFSYYDFNTSNRVFEIIDHGDTVTDDNKNCTSQIELIRELPWLEVLELCNMGKGNSGLSNAGNYNAGNDNAGNSNAGNSNAGNYNAGYSNAGSRNVGNDNAGNDNAGNDNAGNSNAGSRNAGNYNAGYSNAGNYNAGSRNAGYSNAGNSNAGNYNAGNSNAGNDNAGNSNAGNYNAGNDNAGNSNAGYSNAGNSNAGSRNAGNYNAGNSNAGNYNAGNYNAGNSNAGNYNAGSRNAGYSNAGNDNAGAFNNLEKPAYILFNKPSKWTYDDFINSEAYRYLSQVETTLWVPDYKMTEEEKKDFPYYVTTSGYSKTIPYKEAFANSWNNWNDAARLSFQKLPNFSSKIFFEITGIQV